MDVLVGYLVDGVNVDADVVGGVLVQSSDVVTERRRTEDVTILNHVAAYSLIANLEAAHLHQAVLGHRPFNLSYSQSTHQRHLCKSIKLNQIIHKSSY